MLSYYKYYKKCFSSKVQNCLNPNYFLRIIFDRKILISYCYISFFIGDAIGEQHEDSLPLHRLPWSSQYWYVLRSSPLQCHWILRLSQIRRRHRRVDHTQSPKRPGSRPIRKHHDSRCYLPHLRSPILRSYGNHLEESETIFRFEETRWRISCPHYPRHLHSCRSNRCSQFGTSDIPSRCCMSFHNGSDVPIGHRTRHRLGTREWTWKVELEVMEEHRHHMFRYPRFLDGNLLQYTGDGKSEMSEAFFGFSTTLSSSE